MKELLMWAFSIFLILAVASAFVMVEATQRSRERTACYKGVLAGKGVMEDCPIPEKWENKLKELLL